MKGHIRKEEINTVSLLILVLIQRQEKEDRSGFLDIRQKRSTVDVAKKITELNEGTFIEPSKVTLKDYLNHWLEIKSMSIQKSTFAGYRAFINQHVIPSIGMVALHKLNVMHIQKCYKTAIDKGITNNSILLMHRILKSALNLAVKQNIISRNPAILLRYLKEKPLSRLGQRKK